MGYKIQIPTLDKLVNDDENSCQMGIVFFILSIQILNDKILTHEKP